MNPDNRNSPVQTIMATISSLIASRRIEDKLRAVTLMNEYKEKLPSPFLDRILEDLKKNSHSEIQEAILPLLEEDIEVITPVPVSNAEIVANYSDSLEGALKKAFDIVNIFDLSHVTAQALRHYFAEGSTESGNDLFSDFIQQKKKLSADLALFPQFSLKVSPIGTLSDIISTIPDISKKNGKTLLSTDKKNIETKLDEILVTDQEISFNIAGYELLYTLERLIRDLIHERIMKPHMQNLQTKIPVDVLEGMKKRKDIEENNALSLGTYELIEYCDFTDLKKILEKGRNHEFFGDIFSFEEIKAVYSKLGELDPIRKKIAHSRPLTRKEFERLRLYATDILDKIKK